MSNPTRQHEDASFLGGMEAMLLLDHEAVKSAVARGMDTNRIFTIHDNAEELVAVDRLTDTYLGINPCDQAVNGIRIGLHEALSAGRNASRLILFNSLDYPKLQGLPDLDLIPPSFALWDNQEVATWKNAHSGMFSILDNIAQRITARHLSERMYQPARICLLGVAIHTENQARAILEPR